MNGRKHQMRIHIPIVGPFLRLSRIWIWGRKKVFVHILHFVGLLHYNIHTFTFTFSGKLVVFFSLLLASPAYTHTYIDTERWKALYFFQFSSCFDDILYNIHHSGNKERAKNSMRRLGRPHSAYNVIVTHSVPIKYIHFCSQLKKNNRHESIHNNISFLRFRLFFFSLIILNPVQMAL